MIIGNLESSSRDQSKRDFLKDLDRDPLMVARVIREGLERCGLTRHEARGLWGFVTEVESQEVSSAPD